MKMPSTTTTSEKEWPVRLYRFTESVGWQVQEGPKIAASPRKDCIVIPSLRQKFSLVRQKSSVVRRGSCVLLVSQRRTRAMVLRFESLQDCLEFNDRFAELNPPLASIPTEVSPQSSEAQQEQVISYVARLLHDKEFLGFVHKLESHLTNTTDGEKLLEGLEERNLEN